VWREHLGAVDHAPEIDGKDALPVLGWAEHLAARLDAGIVHQDVGAAEALLNGAFQFLHLFDAADIDGRSHDAGGAARNLRQLGFGLLQPFPADIGDTDLHAGPGEPHRGGEPDAGGASRDHGDIVGRHRFEGHLRPPDRQELYIAQITIPQRIDRHRNRKGEQHGCHTGNSDHPPSPMRMVPTRKC
jgi:hypothetical protein